MDSAACLSLCRSLHSSHNTTWSENNPHIFISHVNSQVRFVCLFILCRLTIISRNIHPVNEAHNLWNVGVYSVLQQITGTACLIFCILCHLAIISRNIHRVNEAHNLWKVGVYSLLYSKANPDSSVIRLAIYESSAPKLSRRRRLQVCGAIGRIAYARPIITSKLFFRHNCAYVSAICLPQYLQTGQKIV